MGGMRILSAAEQVAAHLRAELMEGRMSGLMPGVLKLEAELGVNRNTVEAALRELEMEGLLVAQGAGRRRRIALRGKRPKVGLRLGMLLSEPATRNVSYMVALDHRLREAGHTVSYAPKYLFDPGMNLERVSRMVKRQEVAAWLVEGGTQEVLEWLAARAMPVMAIFGRRRGVPLASVGPDKVPAMAATTRELIGLGHRRIVLLSRRVRRLPVPGAVERAFLNELTAHGIEPGPYHLPDWEETVDGFYDRLESLFQLTAPTALIVDDVPFFVATQQFLATRGMRVPGEVSLVCMDASPDFDWCRPSVAHIRWDSQPLVRRVLQWADNVSRGKKDLRQTFTLAEFVKGGTVGRVSSEQ